MTALYCCCDLTRGNDDIDKEPPLPIWQGTRIRLRNECHVFHRDPSISILCIHLRHPSKHQNNNLRHHLLYRIPAVTPFRYPTRMPCLSYNYPFPISIFRVYSDIMLHTSLDPFTVPFRLHPAAYSYLAGSWTYMPCMIGMVNPGATDVRGETLAVHGPHMS